MKKMNTGQTTYSYGRSYYETYENGISREWVMTNGLGGYAGSSIIDSPMRMHHGHLIASLHSPVRRYLVLSKMNEVLTMGDNTHPLHTTKYEDRITEGFKHLQNFYYDTFPIYTYQVQDAIVKKSILLEHGKNNVMVRYEIITGSQAIMLKLKPAFNFRVHGDASSKDDHNFTMETLERQLLLEPSDEKVSISYRISEGEFSPSENEYDERNYYDFEFQTGMVGIDTHYTPYGHEVYAPPHTTKAFYVQCEINQLGTPCTIESSNNLHENFENMMRKHLDRSKSLVEKADTENPLLKRLALSADHFITERKSTGLKTVLAGLPWFSDWGRDTMIALCGLTLSTGRYEDAREILLSFSKYINKGLLPNVFPDLGSEPMYNSVDASLWYFQAIHQYYDYTKDLSLIEELYPALHDMIQWFIKGTDFSIYMDTDHLVQAGSGLDQVTWMDVRINGFCVTPRHGKPVEINALWYNALKVMDAFSILLEESPQINDTTFHDMAELVKTSFVSKFWNEENQCLLDVVDPDDTAIRPNQSYAISLAYTMLSAEKEKAIVDTLHKKLYTSYGLRSLDPNHEEYKPIYTGELIKRDFAYHQGTVWGFLLGSFIDAYRKVYPQVSKETIYDRFILPIEDHLTDGCIGGYSEIFDGDAPHHQRGCYTQAWSVAEAIRVIKELE